MQLETISLNELRDPQGGDAMRLRPLSVPRLCADPYTGEVQVTQTPTRAVQTLDCEGQSWWMEVGRLRRGLGGTTYGILQMWVKLSGERGSSPVLSTLCDLIHTSSIRTQFPYL